MRATRLVATVLLIAALGGIGCSKRESRKAKAAREAAEQTKPVEKPRESQAVAPAAPIVPPAITVTASFADGEAAFRARNYNEATAIFEAYVDRKPGNGWGYYMLGLSAWKGGDFPKAEKAFDHALSIDPNHVKTLVNSSRLFIDQRRHDDAIARLTRAGEIDPESAEVQRLLAQTYRVQGKTVEAVDAYQRALDLNDSDAWTMNNLATLLMESERVSEAMALLEKAIELRPSIAEFQKNLETAIATAKIGPGMN
jgi:tetratricopeptide (TPR) repeat protein